MSDLAGLLSKVIASFGEKYGTETIKKAKFTPKIKLNFSQEPPVKSGGGTGAAEKGLVWESPIWATPDAIDGYQRSFPKPFKKPLAENDAKILLNLVGGVTGDMNLHDDIKKVHGLYDKLYSDKIKVERAKQDESTGDAKELINGIKSFWDKLEKDNKSALDSREKILSDLKSKAFFDDDIASKVKSSFLRFTTPEKILKQVKRMLGEDSEGKKENPEEKKTDLKHEVPKKNPVLDPDKKEFTKEDRNWVMDKIYNNRETGGIKGIIKQMSKYFNKNLVNEAQLAAEKTGHDLKKFYDYFYDYTRNKNNLERGLKDKVTLPDSTSKDELTEPVTKVLKFLEGIQKKMGEDYKGSLYSKTEELVRLIQRYNRSKSRDRRLERALLEAFQANVEEPDLPEEDGEDASDKPKGTKGIGKAWVKLKTPITKDIKKIQDLLAEWSEKDEIRNVGEDAKQIKEIQEENDAQNKKEISKTDIGRSVLKFLENTHELSDKDKEVNKERKKDQGNKIKELSNQNKNKTFRFSLNKVKEHLNKVKSSFKRDWEGGTLPLYKRTDELLDLVSRYNSKGNFNPITTDYLLKLLNGAIPVWKVVDDQVMLKYLKKLKSSISDALVSNQDDETSLDKSLFHDLEAFDGTWQNKKDSEIADILDPENKKEKEKKKKRREEAERKKEEKKTQEKNKAPEEDAKKSSSKVSSLYLGTFLGKIQKIASYTADPLIREELRSIYISIKRQF